MQRVFELRNEIAQFLSDQNSNLATHFKDPAWNAKLAYLADVFDELNKLNTSMQGPQTNILDLSDKSNGFTEKVQRWIERVRNGVTAMFPCYTELNDGERVDISDTICAHLTVLVDGFRKYFGDLENYLKTDKDLCESGFSALASIKTKQRARLDVKDEMRVCLSKIAPRIDDLCKAHQAHLSH